MGWKPHRKSGPAFNGHLPAHFPRGERHDRFCGRQKLHGEGSSLSGECYRPEEWAGCGTEDLPPRQGSRAFSERSTWEDCLQCSLTAGG